MAHLDRDDAGRLAAAVVLLGSIPASLAVLGALLAAFAGLGQFAAIVPFLPPFLAAILVGERAYPASLRGELVRATLIATFCGVATFLAGAVLFGGGHRTGAASLAALATYAAGAVAVHRDRFQDERLWPGVAAAAAAVFWVVALAVG